jgi:hypothetical protein
MTPQEKFEVTPASGDDHQSRGDLHGHSWMMMACCIPMIVIAVILFATGVIGAGFIFIALLCTVMMALMMGAMDHDARC